MKLSDIEDPRYPRPIITRYMEVLGLNIKATARVLNCSQSMVGHYVRGDTRTPAGVISTMRLLVYMRELGMLDEALKIVHELGDIELTEPRNFI